MIRAIWCVIALLGVPLVGHVVKLKAIHLRDGIARCSRSIKKPIGMY